MPRSWQRELISSYRLSYRRADRSTKGAMLDKICARTGYHRKYAIHLLNQYATRRPARTRGRPRRTSAVADKTLGAMWYVLGRPGAIQLQERLSEGLEWAREQLQLDPEEVERELRGLSVRTIDRRLETFRLQFAERGSARRRAAPNRPAGKRYYGVRWPRQSDNLRRYRMQARSTLKRAELGEAKEESLAKGEGLMSAEFTPRKRKDVMVISAEGKMVAGDQAFRLMKLAIKTMNETDIRKFVVDLGKVTLIDSAGVGELVAVNTAIKEKGGQLRISNLEDSVGKVLQMALIHKIIPEFDTQKEAIASFEEDDD